MSVVYESRHLFHDGSYPNMGEPNETDGLPQATDIGDLEAGFAAVANYNTAAAAAILADADSRTDMVESPVAPKEDSPVSSPPATGRTRAIPKPERQIHKNANGCYACTWPNCTEDVKEFNRRCEWR